MTTEIIELKDIYRGFIALRLATLRLADGARVSREIIQHGKAAVALPNGAPGAVPSCSCLPVRSSMPKMGVSAWRLAPAPKRNETNRC